MDKKYLVIFIIFCLIILCKNNIKESFTSSDESYDLSGVQDSLKNFLDYNVNDIPPGIIVSFTGTENDIPDGWVLCDGRNFKDKNGNAKPSPDLRGRFLIGAGTGTNLTERKLNQKGGNETITLNVENLPKHNHSGTSENDGEHQHNYNKPNNKAGVVGAYDNRQWYYSDTTSASTGGGGAHTHSFTTDPNDEHENKEIDIMPPYYVVSYIIKSKQDLIIKKNSK